MKIENKKGYIKYTREDNEIIIDMVYIKPEYRGKGHARRLMNRMMNRILSWKRSIPVTLLAYGQDKDTETRRVVEFYENFGFSKTEDFGDMVEMEYKL